MLCWKKEFISCNLGRRLKKNGKTSSEIFCLFVAIYVDCFLPLISIPLVLTIKGEAIIISLIILIIVWIADIVFFVLSFFKLWNIPIGINSKGIIYNKLFFHEWKDAESITVQRKWRVKYGYLHFRVIIVFSNNSIVSFKPNELINKDIINLCTDEQFLAKYKNAIEIDD